MLIIQLDYTPTFHKPSWTHHSHDTSNETSIFAYVSHKQSHHSCIGKFIPVPWMGHGILMVNVFWLCQKFFWKALASPNMVWIPWFAVAAPLVWTSTNMSTKMMMTHRILSIFKDSRSFGPKVGKNVGIGGCYLKVLLVWFVLCVVSFNLWGDVVWVHSNQMVQDTYCMFSFFGCFFGETGLQKTTHTWKIQVYQNSDK